MQILRWISRAAISFITSWNTDFLPTAHHIETHMWNVHQLAYFIGQWWHCGCCFFKPNKTSKTSEGEVWSGSTQFAIQHCLTHYYGKTTLFKFSDNYSNFFRTPNLFDFYGKYTHLFVLSFRREPEAECVDSKILEINRSNRILIKQLWSLQKKRRKKKSFWLWDDLTDDQTHMSLAMRKRVFGSFRSGQTQTGLLSYRS